MVPYQFEPELSADSAPQVDAAHGVDVSGRLGHTQWCICGSNCASMNLELENVCCGEFEKVRLFVEQRSASQSIHLLPMWSSM